MSEWGSVLRARAKSLTQGVLSPSEPMGPWQACAWLHRVDGALERLELGEGFVPDAGARGRGTGVESLHRPGIAAG